MYQEFEAHRLSGIWCHVHGLANPDLVIRALVEEGLQDVTVRVGDVSVLPVEVDGVSATGPVPKTQGAVIAGYCELLIQRAVSDGRLSGRAAEISCLRVAAHKRGESAAMRLRVCDHRRVVVAVDHPRRQTAGLESAVCDRRAVADRPLIIVISRERDIRIAKHVGDGSCANRRFKGAAEVAKEIDGKAAGRVSIDQLNTLY